MIIEHLSDLPRMNPPVKRTELATDRNSPQTHKAVDGEDVIILLHRTPGDRQKQLSMSTSVTSICQKRGVTLGI
jgi:hypothetical protein